jgi:hypothetical protein
MRAPAGAVIVRWMEQYGCSHAISIRRTIVRAAARQAGASPDGATAPGTMPLSRHSPAEKLHFSYYFQSDAFGISLFSTLFSMLRCRCISYVSAMECFKSPTMVGLQ